MNDKALLEFKRWKDKKVARRRRLHFSESINMQELNLVAMMDMMTILLVFLLKSYSVSALSVPVGGEISVPMSNNQMNPKEAVKLTITKVGTADAVVAVDEEAIIKLDEATIEKLRAQTKRRQFMIPELHKALVAKADKIKKMAQLQSQASQPAQAGAPAPQQVTFDRKIMVLADKTTPYWLVTAVLFTSAEAEFDQYQLVALREDQN
jgi:biopolymer transport protein ExbD